MALLKSVISEMAAGGSTGAGAIAGFRGSLFGGGMVNVPKRRKRMFRRMMNVSPTGVHNVRESIGINSDKTKFNAADVISKLDAAEKKNKKSNDDTVCFGMEDESGNTVKVYVRADQADQFEHVLGAMLGSVDENSDDKNTSVEIAEVLYDLKDKFEIVDVDWGEIQGDVEEEQEVETEGGAPGEGGPDSIEAMGGEAGAEGGELGGEEQPGLEEPGLEAGGGEEDVKGMLGQVIDVLKSQAQAAKAEADARTAEAKAKEAEFAARAAEAKVRQEEEVLDMEDYYKDKGEEKKETQRLAKLAKFKHDKAKEAGSVLSSGGGNLNPELGGGLGGVEGEEKMVVSPRELAQAIFRQLKGQ